MAKLAVLDPSGLYRAGMISLLQALGFGDLVEGADVEELARRVGDGAEPDVVLVNLSRNARAIDALMRDAAEAFGHTRVVFLAENSGAGDVVALFRGGRERLSPGEHFPRHARQEPDAAGVGR